MDTGTTTARPGRLQRGLCHRHRPEHPALVSAGVVVAGGMALWFGWAWLDPVVSLAIAAVIVVGTWSLFRRSLHLLFHGVPESVDLRAVQALLEALPGVARVHDLHVWAMGTSEIALTADLVVPDNLPTTPSCRTPRNFCTIALRSNTSRCR